MANHKIEDIEGVGDVIGEKFRSAGIKDTNSLLANSRTAEQRKELAKKTGLSEARILKFANMADLYRISGIGSEFSELLEATGVNSVPDLARQNATSLTQKMMTINEKKKLTRREPSEKDVSKWIEQAGTLPQMLDH
jgi:predicted flap endonuclease-1-like 5' DNA nuclease